MPHWRSMMDRDTMGAWDLIDPKTKKPRDWTLEIERVEKRLVKSKEKPNGENKPHVYFVGARKPLVAGATICEEIENIAGSDDTDRWVGLRITLYPTRVKGKGKKQCAGIRVRPMRATGPVEQMGDGQPVDEAMRAEQEDAHRDEAPAPEATT